MKWYNLNFEVDKLWRKRSWIQRLAARIVANMIINTESDTYQFGGWRSSKQPTPYTFIQADKYQLAHWVLRESGYHCCVADIMKRAGKKVFAKPTRDGAYELAIDSNVHKARVKPDIAFPDKEQN